MNRFEFMLPDQIINAIPGPQQEKLSLDKGL